LEPDEVVKEIMDEEGVVASAVVTKDGQTLAVNVPEGKSADVFSILGATLFGAGDASHNNMWGGKITDVTAVGERGAILAAGDGGVVICCALELEKPGEKKATKRVEKVKERMKKLLVEVQKSESFSSMV